MSCKCFTFVLIVYICCNVIYSKRPPNIIFFIADQQRQDSIGAYPDSVGITPNLDSLADDGILFVNSWTSTPSCTPARSAILTGRNPWGHGMIGYGSVATKFPYELVPPLNDKGYITASIGKNHFGFYTYNGTFNPATHEYSYLDLYDGLGNGLPQNDSNCAYDDYDEHFQYVLPGDDPLATGKPLLNWNSWEGSPYIYNESIHPTSWVTESALSWIDNYITNEEVYNIVPFFLKISYHRPHSPYDPPQEYINQVINEYDLDRVTNILHGNYWDERFANNEWCQQSMTAAWCGWFQENITNFSRIAYHANVKFIDTEMGTILNKLKESDLYNNSYILWTADHGDQLGDHNLWRKTYPYNSNAKIPMIIKWPNKYGNTDFNVDDIAIPRGTINYDNIVELRDLLPTFHNVSGIIIPDHFNGTNWTVDGLNMNCILYNECQWRSWLDLEHSTCYNETNHWNALTDGLTYKYIFNAFFGNESLFNLSNDPNEMNDLAPLALNNTSINATLIEWRTRLINMFEQQNRGDTWVKNGELQIRPKGQTYSPNYPGNPAPCQG